MILISTTSKKAKVKITIVVDDTKFHQIVMNVCSSNSNAAFKMKTLIKKYQIAKEKKFNPTRKSFTL